MGKKYISIEEAQAVYESIVKKYVSPKFDGKTLITLPQIDFASIFGNRKRMDAERLTQEVCKILDEQIK